MRATPLICVALVCITVFTAIATATEKTGLFVWSQSIIQGDADYTADELQQQLLTFMDGGGGTAAVDASLEGGRIIQDGASIHSTCPGGASTFEQFAAYIGKVDGAGHRFSLMYSKPNYVSSDQPQIICYVNAFLDLLKDDAVATAGSWTTNTTDGHPTIEIFLDIEPVLPNDPGALQSNLEALRDVLKAARDLIDTHNATAPHVRATLGAVLTIGTIVPPAELPPTSIQIPCPDVSSTDIDCYECALGYLDRATVLAYRTVNCMYAGGCSDPVCCPIAAGQCTPNADPTKPTGSDGIAFFAYKVLDKAKSMGKAVSIGLEVHPTDVVGPCRKVSFGFLMGADGYSSHPAKRVAYMQNVKKECVDEMARAHVSGPFDPDALFTLNDFSGYHCFATGNAWTGSSQACESVGASCSGCAPTQAPYVLSGDLNGDGIVDTLDLAELQSALDTGPHDTNFDGEVDVFDLLNLISIWGTQYPAP